MTRSLENLLETAYGRLAQANEPALADLPPRLSTLILAQAPDPGAGDGTDAERVPAKYWLLTAKRGEESIPNTGIFETELTIEVGMNAQEASADGGALDALFGATIRPLIYSIITDDPPLPSNPRNLFQALSAPSDNFKVYGMPRRSNSGEMVVEGSMCIRRETATFHCQKLN